MKYRIANPADLGAGLLFMVFGLGALSALVLYDFGTAAAMGPGYFPAAVGALLLLLGGALVGRSVRSGAPSEALLRPAWRELFWILAGILFFALTVEWLGFLVSAFGLLVLSRLADPRVRWREVLVFSAIVSAMAALIFVKGLGVLVPLLPRLV